MRLLARVEQAEARVRQLRTQASPPIGRWWLDAAAASDETLEATVAVSDRVLALADSGSVAPDATLGEAAAQDPELDRLMCALMDAIARADEAKGGALSRAWPDWSQA